MNDDQDSQYSKKQVVITEGSIRKEKNEHSQSHYCKKIAGIQKKIQKKPAKGKT
jgi:hypothetical protein